MSWTLQTWGIIYNPFPISLIKNHDPCDKGKLCLAPLEWIAKSIFVYLFKPPICIDFWGHQAWSIEGEPHRHRGSIASVRDGEARYWCHWWVASWQLLRVEGFSQFEAWPFWHSALWVFTIGLFFFFLVDLRWYIVLDMWTCTID